MRRIRRTHKIIIFYVFNTLSIRNFHFVAQDGHSEPYPGVSSTDLGRMSAASLSRGSRSGAPGSIRPVAAVAACEGIGSMFPAPERAESFLTAHAPQPSETAIIDIYRQHKDDFRASPRQPEQSRSAEMMHGTAPRPIRWLGYCGAATAASEKHGPRTLAGKSGQCAGGG
jgi:hypothetical protein